MLSIESLLTGYDSTSHANYLVPFNFSSVQEYLENSGMTRNSTWGTDLEMMCFCHMFSVDLYSFHAVGTLGSYSVQSILREDCPVLTKS